MGILFTIFVNLSDIINIYWFILEVTIISPSMLMATLLSGYIGGNSFCSVVFYEILLYFVRMFGNVVMYSMLTQNFRLAGRAGSGVDYPALLRFWAREIISRSYWSYELKKRRIYSASCLWILGWLTEVSSNCRSAEEVESCMMYFLVAFEQLFTNENFERSTNFLA